MALDPSKLQRLLQRVAEKPSRTPVEAGYAWARAYRQYCDDAASPMGGSPLTLDAAEQLLGSSLAGAFANPAGDPSTASNFMGLSFTSFWLLPPVVFSGTPPGAVTVVPGSLVLPTALFSTFAVNLATRATNEQSAQRLAQALDSFTRTVTVLHPVVPTPVVGPIT